MPELMTTKEVAAALRVSTPTVRKLVATSELPGFRVGKCYRIPSAAVAKILEGCGVPRTEAA